MKRVVILRGLPGSGKSTYVRRLIHERQDSVIASADDFLYDDNGVYHFTPERACIAHAMCFQTAYAAVDKGVSQIIIDNTNIKKDRYIQYVELAKAHGYEIEFFNIYDGNKSDEELTKRNRHNVSIDIIKKMRREFEQAP